MNSDITFRTGKTEDIPAFLAFFKTSLPTLFTQYSSNSINYEVEDDYGPQFLTEKLGNGEKKVYLALKEDCVVGYLLVMKSIAGVSFADWLGVGTTHQKKGIASKLLTFWEQEALVEGAHILQLWTTKNNVEFYKKRGFVCGGLFPKAWHGEDCYLIYRILREPEEKNFLKEYLGHKKKV